MEVRLSLPGEPDTQGLWPGVWTLGNLGRAGYGGASESISALLEPQLTPPWLPSLSSTGSVDGVWPYSCVPSPCTCSSRLRL